MTRMYNAREIKTAIQIVYNELKEEIDNYERVPDWCLYQFKLKLNENLELPGWHKC